MNKNVGYYTSGSGAFRPHFSRYARFYLKLSLCASMLVAMYAGSHLAYGSETITITQFKIRKEGVLDFAWEGTTNKVTVQLSPSLTSPDWQSIAGVDWPVTGTHWTGAIPRGRTSSYLRLVSYQPGGTLLRSKTISLDLIGIHDSGSSAFNADCISCHGDRTKDVALDGKTPAAHATMAELFGKGNQACLKCHKTGPDFLTYSGGGLRNQINRNSAGCFSCHDTSSDHPFYAQ